MADLFDAAICGGRGAACGAASRAPAPAARCEYSGAVRAAWREAYASAQQEIVAKYTPGQRSEFQFAAAAAPAAAASAAGDGEEQDQVQEGGAGGSLADGGGE